MEKHLLLTVGDSRQVSAPLHFIGNFFSNHCDVRLTLLYVVTMGMHMKLEEYDKSTEAQEDKAIVAGREAKGRKALAEAKEWIVRGGCEEQKIHTKVVYSAEGISPAIVVEARKGLYDAVFLGRRGLTWFEEIIEDSVSREILWGDIDFPVWCCRRTDLMARDNVLLCVLGNEADRRMADHVGFMLEGEERHKVTLFHVSRDEVGTEELEALVAPHRSELVRNGFPEERVEVKSVRAGNVEKAIVGEAESGRYAVVALGRQKNEPSGIKRIFPDSISGRLLRMIEYSCIWISK